MPHVLFISHASQDHETAMAVCMALEDAGVPCWIAPRDVVPGREWDEEIVQAINDSQAIVLVFSARSNASPQVKREVVCAANRRIPIVPFRIENVALSPSIEYFISGTHWLDAFTSPLQPHLANLVKGVQRLLSSHAKTGESPPQLSFHAPDGFDRLDPLPDGSMRFRRTADKADMLLVPGGKFSMGSHDGDSDERPVHAVQLSSFLLDASPVSRRQFVAFLNIWGSEFDDEGNRMVDPDLAGIDQHGARWDTAGGGDEPVTAVTWYGAKTYSHWVNVHLPSEAQLEFAITLVADEQSDWSTRLMRLLGLVRHWCADYYDEQYYRNCDDHDPVNVLRAPFASVRGTSRLGGVGNWTRTQRQFHAPHDSVLDLGFRCALTLDCPSSQATEKHQ